MSIDIKNVLHAQAQLREMYSNRDSGTRQTEPAADRQPVKAGLADRVTISAAAQHLARAGEAHASEPVINTGRVDEIRQSLIEGSYRIDPAQIAEKLRLFGIRLH